MDDYIQRLPSVPQEPEEPSIIISNAEFNEIERVLLAMEDGTYQRAYPAGAAASVKQLRTPDEAPLLLWSPDQEMAEFDRLLNDDYFPGDAIPMEGILDLALPVAAPEEMLDELLPSSQQLAPDVVPEIAVNMEPASPVDFEFFDVNDQGGSDVSSVYTDDTSDTYTPGYVDLAPPVPITFRLRSRARAQVLSEYIFLNNFPKFPINNYFNFSIFSFQLHLQE